MIKTMIQSIKTTEGIWNIAICSTLVTIYQTNTSLSGILRETRYCKVIINKSIQ